MTDRIEAALAAAHVYKVCAFRDQFMSEEERHVINLAAEVIRLRGEVARITKKLEVLSRSEPTEEEEMQAKAERDRQNAIDMALERR